MKSTLFEEYLGPRLPREVQLKRVKNVIREELTENQREMLLAYYFEKQTMTQIAQQRGVNVSTVSRTIHRAEKKLRKFLKYCLSLTAPQAQWLPPGEGIFGSTEDSLLFPVNLLSYIVRKAGDTVKTRKLTTLSLLCAIALTIFMVEAQIPALVPIPGIKLGLANIVTVFTVFAIGAKEGALVLAVRIFLGAVFAGNFSTIFYSAGGGVLAIGVTILLKKILTKKQLWVAGTLGAIAHSLGQMAVAVAITATPGLALYLPVMIAVSIVTGSFTGLCAQLLVNRGSLWKITSL